MNNNYITITEVNRYIKEIINEDLLLRKVYLKGKYLTSKPILEDIITFSKR